MVIAALSSAVLILCGTTAFFFVVALAFDQDQKAKSKQISQLNDDLKKRETLLAQTKSVSDRRFRRYRSALVTMVIERDKVRGDKHDLERQVASLKEALATADEFLTKHPLIEAKRRRRKS